MREATQEGIPRTETLEFVEGWDEFTRPGEDLLWTGRPDKKRLVQLCVTFGVVIGFFTVFLWWSALTYDNLFEACGDNPSRSCRRASNLYGPGAVFFSGLIAYIGYHFSRILVGRSVVVHGVTDQWAFVWRSWGSNNFSFVNLDTIDPELIENQRVFGSLSFGSKRISQLRFTALSDEDVDRATFAALYRKPLEAWWPSAAMEAARSYTGQPPRRPLYLLT